MTTYRDLLNQLDKVCAKLDEISGLYNEIYDIVDDLDEGQELPDSLLNEISAKIDFIVDVSYGMTEIDSLDF